MPISIPTFLFYLLLIASESARAQVSAPTNCTGLDWSFNSLQQGPCLVAAYLAAVCNDGVFSIPDLLPQHSYTGPNGPDDDDLCKCNTVLYNLISACDTCQGEPWNPYSTWSFNCTTKINGNFPEPVPIGTRVPKWAYIDTSISDSWNISAAQAVGDSPEVTGTVSIIPTSTVGVSHSTLSSTSGSSSSSTSTSHSSSKSGAIAGGVVGGILGAALIVGIVAWFVVRGRRARYGPSITTYTSGQGGEMTEPVPYPLSIETPKLYNPSDPATYPSKEYLPVSNQPLSSESIRHLRPNDAGYSGLPEI